MCVVAHIFYDNVLLFMIKQLFCLYGQYENERGAVGIYLEKV